eukprot:TRINITY_DN4198_c0_g1_i1.p2 TRINITY_DN4198_c0_g1~~TRINITY_DN4198_c0_g1_i1.p2  ORF type:complete len:125 (+),score=19.36 TRINITY_DN4198_c0_g1_i1:18-392(+)
MDPKKDNKEIEQNEERLNYRVTITHRNVKEIERVCSKIITQGEAKNKEAEGTVSTRGPMRMPTKVLRITTRKAPCGNGTNTYDRYEMRIHKRVIDIECSETTFGQLTSINIPAGMIIEATELDE